MYAILPGMLSMGLASGVRGSLIALMIFKRSFSFETYWIMHMKTLVVLTGGTFGSVQSEGFWRAELGQGDLSKLDVVRQKFPDVELTFVQPFSKLSENVTPADWWKILRSLMEWRDTFDNVIVVHGTDTMAYSAAAVAYFNAAFLGTTIVFTGANLPLVADQTDAVVNFQQSVLALKRFAENGINGCFVVFNGQDDVTRPAKIHAATRVKKFKWDDYCYRSYYMSNNGDCIGEVSDTCFEFDRVRYQSMMANAGCKDMPKPEFSGNRVFAAKIYPGMHPDMLPKPGGQARVILLELYNSGTAPADDSEYSLVDWVSAVSKAGGIVFAISQHEGKSGLSMSIYETSDALLLAGIVPLKDMIWEAAVPKLTLAANCFDGREELVAFVNSNIAGEIINAS